MPVRRLYSGLSPGASRQQENCLVDSSVPWLEATLKQAMIQIVNSALDLISNASELIATIAAIVRGFGELFQALRTILRLIASLAGG